MVQRNLCWIGPKQCYNHTSEANDERGGPTKHRTNCHQSNFAQRHRSIDIYKTYQLYNSGKLSNLQIRLRQITRFKFRLTKISHKTEFAEEGKRLGKGSTGVWPVLGPEPRLESNVGAWQRKKSILRAQHRRRRRRGWAWHRSCLPTPPPPCRSSKKDKNTIIIVDGP